MADDGEGDICEGLGASGEVLLSTTVLFEWLEARGNELSLSSRSQGSEGCWRKQGVIPWFVYVVCVIIVIIVVAHTDALRNYRRRDMRREKISIHRKLTRPGRPTNLTIKHVAPG